MLMLLIQVKSGIFIVCLKPGAPRPVTNATIKAWVRFCLFAYGRKSKPPALRVVVDSIQKIYADHLLSQLLRSFIDDSQGFALTAGNKFRLYEFDANTDSHHSFDMG